MSLSQIQLFQVVRLLDLLTLAVAVQALLVEVPVARCTAIILRRLANLVAHWLHLNRSSCSVVIYLIRYLLSLVDEVARAGRVCPI